MRTFSGNSQLNDEYYQRDETHLNAVGREVLIGALKAIVDSINFDIFRGRMSFPTWLGERAIEWKF